MSEPNAVPVYVVDYTPAWPAVFQELSRLIGAKLGGLASRIEHVGSTSVAGLAAKPIIDLDIVIASRDDLSAVIELLHELGYVYEGDNGVAGREAFDRHSWSHPLPGYNPDVLWMLHHLYVCAPDSGALNDHLVFRDYLRANPQVRDEYAELKRELAQRFRHDRRAYGEGKTEFVMGILGRARARQVNC